MKQTILTQITDRMTDRNIGKTEILKTLNISRTTLWRYLENKKDIPLETFLKICEVLELEIIIK
jgi:DNA-binding Xre family transcriptional regulator